MEADKDAWKALLRQNSTGGRIQLPNGGFCWSEGNAHIPAEALRNLQRRYTSSSPGEKEDPLTSEEVANIEAAANKQCFVTGLRGMHSLMGLPLCCHPRDLQVFSTTFSESQILFLPPPQNLKSKAHFIIRRKIRRKHRKGTREYGLI